MKIYLVKEKSKLPIIKRLVQLKADIGVCDWAGDFKNTNINCDDIIDFIDTRLQELTTNCTMIKEMAYEDDLQYFNEVNSDSNVKAALTHGIINADTVHLVSKNCPSILKDIIEEVNSNQFIWII